MPKFDSAPNRGHSLGIHTTKTLLITTLLMFAF